MCTYLLFISQFLTSLVLYLLESGLTEKQRSLTIIIIVLLCYVAFGAAVHTALLSLSFIDALYFTVVCIETVGECTSS
jgi:potassium channel subfamily K